MRRTAACVPGELGLDVLLCSPYKFFGPHLGVAAIRPELAASLPADRVRPAEQEPPGHRFETGTQSHEAIAGAVAAIDYLRSLGDGDLDAAFERIEGYETDLAKRFLAGLPDSVTLYGIPAVEGRTPTFCFNVEGRRPREVAEALGERGIYVWDGNYYALEPMRALGLEDGGRGPGRLPPLHDRGRGRPPARGARRALDVPAAEPVLDGAHLVVERLVGAIAALVELQDRVDARHALVEGQRVQLADDAEDVLRRALERGAHRVHPEADAILQGEPALDLGYVAACADLAAAEGEDGQIGGRHR